MKKALMVILALVALAFSVTATTQTIDVGTPGDGLDTAFFEWSEPNLPGCYGCQDVTEPTKDGTYRTVWEPILGTCPWYAAPATFEMVVPEGEYAKTLKMEILNGCSNEDSFYIGVSDGNGVRWIDYWEDEEGTYPGSCEASAEDWIEVEFPMDNEQGNLIFIIWPYEEDKPWTPWALCGTYGQVAVQKISLESSDYGGSGEIPEFSAIGAGLALAGAGAGFILLRRKK